MENDIMVNMDPDQVANEMFAGFGTIILVFLLVALVFYVFYGYCWFLLAKKTNTENEWMAFVPILNLYLMTVIGKRQGWELLLMFIPLVNFVWIIVLMNSISKRFGKGVPMTLALIFLGPFSLPYLAFTYPQETLNQAPKAPDAPIRPIEM